MFSLSCNLSRFPVFPTRSASETTSGVTPNVAAARGVNPLPVAAMAVYFFIGLTSQTRCASCHASTGLSVQTVVVTGVLAFAVSRTGLKRGSAAQPKPSKHQNSSLTTSTSRPHDQRLCARPSTPALPRFTAWWYSHYRNMRQESFTVLNKTTNGEGGCSRRGRRRPAASHMHAARTTTAE